MGAGDQQIHRILFGEREVLNQHMRKRHNANTHAQVGFTNTVSDSKPFRVAWLGALPAFLLVRKMRGMRNGVPPSKTKKSSFCGFLSGISFREFPGSFHVSFPAYRSVGAGLGGARPHGARSAGRAGDSEGSWKGVNSHGAAKKCSICLHVFVVFTVFFKKQQFFCFLIYTYIYIYIFFMYLPLLVLKGI